ncbi:MAG: hypothetical protein V7750_12325 [Sneathiella sp.]
MDVEFSGFIAGDLRIFSENGLQEGQSDARLNPSIVVQPEWSAEWNDGDDSIDFIPFVRLDAQDEDRTHVDIRELNYLHIDDGWDVTIGLDKVFWGVMEARHLVDVINQTDNVEDVDGEDKLGQPMINVGLQKEFGDINFFVLPYFRERTFSGRDGRLRAPLEVDTDRTNYDSDLEEFHPDFAIRYATVLGDWDLGLAHFYGTGREPRLVAELDDSGDLVLAPHYDLINQTSVDVQATLDAWLWKFEAIYRTGQGDDFEAVSAGLEYTFFGLIQDVGDLGVLIEYHHDGRDGSAPATIFDHDVFFGLRAAFNDADDTSILGGVILDTETQAQSFTLEASKRLTDRMTFEGELRVFSNQPATDPLYSARDDDHVQLRLSYYF